MNVRQAKEIIINHGIFWTNVFDLNIHLGKDSVLDTAIIRVKEFIIRGA